MNTEMLDRNETIFTEEVEGLLIHYAQNESESIWAIGDLTLQLVNQAKKLKKEMPHANVPDVMQIYEFVSDVTGLADSSVRQRASVAKFYNPEIRSAYEVLSHSHFLVAMRSGELATAVKWLARAVETADDYNGRVMPVRVMAARIAAGNIMDATADEFTPVDRAGKLVSSVKKLYKSISKLRDDIPAPLRVAFDLVLENLQVIKEELEETDGVEISLN